MQELSKVILILPYFGKLPETFNVFLKTCESNQMIHWLIFTDDGEKRYYPQNVKVIKLSFDDFREKIQEKFDFMISLPSPKKLCDYKPAYGYLFEEYIEGFDFWGYCDCDLFWGDFSSFLTKAFLTQYDMIFTLGHLTLYKNEEKINKLFMCTYNSEDAVQKNFKEIYSTNENLVFDEWPRKSVNINVLAMQEGIRTYTGSLNYDVSPRYKNFNNVVPVVNESCNWIDGHKNIIFLWEDGHLFAFYAEEKNLIREEILYAHLQKRWLKIEQEQKVLDSTKFFILPNKIILVPDVQSIEGLAKKYLKWSKIKGYTDLGLLKWKVQKMIEFGKRKMKKILIITNHS